MSPPFFRSPIVIARPTLWNLRIPNPTQIDLKTSESSRSAWSSVWGTEIRAGTFCPFLPPSLTPVGTLSFPFRAVGFRTRLFVASHGVRTGTGLGEAKTQVIRRGFEKKSSIFVQRTMVFGPLASRLPGGGSLLAPWLAMKSRVLEDPKSDTSPGARAPSGLA